MDLVEQAKERRQLVANEAAAKEASRLKSQFLANVRIPCHCAPPAHRLHKITLRVLPANPSDFRCPMRFAPPSLA